VNDDLKKPGFTPPTLSKSSTNLDVKNPKIDPKDLANYLESTALGKADIVGDSDNYALGESDAAVEQLIADIARRTAEQTDVEVEGSIAGVTEGDDDSLAGAGEDGDQNGEDEEKEEDVDFDENAAIEQ